MDTWILQILVPEYLEHFVVLRGEKTKTSVFDERFSFKGLRLKIDFGTSFLSSTSQVYPNFKPSCPVDYQRVNLRWFRHLVFPELVLEQFDSNFCLNSIV